MRSKDWLTPEGTCALLTRRQFRLAIAVSVLSVLGLDIISPLPLGFFYLVPIASTFWSPDTWMPWATAGTAALLLMLGLATTPMEGIDFVVTMRLGGAAIFLGAAGVDQPAPVAGRGDGTGSGVADHVRFRTRLSESAGPRMRAPRHESRWARDAGRRRHRDAARALGAASGGREAAEQLRAAVQRGVQGRVGHAPVRGHGAPGTAHLDGDPDRASTHSRRSGHRDSRRLVGHHRTPPRRGTTAGQRAAADAGRRHRRPGLLRARPHQRRLFWSPSARAILAMHPDQPITTELVVS